MFREFYMQYRATLDLTPSLRIHHQVVVRGPAQRASEELWSKLLDLEKCIFLISKLVDSIARCSGGIRTALNLIGSIKAQISQLGSDIVFVDRSFAEDPSVCNSISDDCVNMDGLLQTLLAIDSPLPIGFSSEIILLEQELADVEQEGRAFLSREP